MKKALSAALICALILLLAACGAPADDSARVLISGDGLSSELSFSMQEMDGWGDTVKYVYSFINNWPNKKFAVAEGIPLQSLLEKAGVWDSFQSITVIAADGYQTSFTREQITCERWYFPALLEDSAEGAEPRPFLLTLGYAQDEDDLAMIEEEDTPRLVFGQHYLNEHSSVAFVENIARIVVSNGEPPRCAAPEAFPAAGEIRRGDTVKLVHDSIGLVKIFYTLDGSEPDYDSAMYNPSTYQPALNAPIAIEGDTVIKAFASGYGYADSETVSFEFKVKQ